MKMSDVFSGKALVKPYENESGVEEFCITEWSVDLEYIGKEMDKVRAEAAAHAINNHDKLVEMNKELVATLEFNLSNPAIHHKTREEFKILINKAKELTNGQ